MAKPRSVQAYKLRDYRLAGWKDTIAGRWSYRQLAADPAWRNGWISFDSVTWNPADNLVYCGLNTIDGDLLYSFDPTNARFESLGARQWADEFDVKIHRTLLLSPKDGGFYFATSLLHDLDRQREAGGGKLVHYDPIVRRYDILAIPVPRLYIQSIAADWQRGLIYGFTYPAEFLFQYEIASGRAENLAYLGNAILFAQPHNAVVDKEGWLWGTCAETRAWDENTGEVPIRLFKYHPEGQRFVWFEHGLSRTDDRRQLLPDPALPGGAEDARNETRHKQDYGFCDAMVYDGERYVYAGTTEGVLCRIDTQNGAVEKIARVIGTVRFPALSFRDGILYGGGGVQGHTQMTRFDTRTGQLTTYTHILDPSINDCPARIHEIAIDRDHNLFLGENDNHLRSSYLWQVRLD